MVVALCPSGEGKGSLSCRVIRRLLRKTAANPPKVVKQAWPSRNDSGPLAFETVYTYPSSAKDSSSRSPKKGVVMLILKRTILGIGMPGVS